MTTITLDNSQQELECFLDRVSRAQERVQIRVKNRFVYLLSQEELDGIQATLELSAIPGMVESILEGGNEPRENCVSPEELGWNIP